MLGYSWDQTNQGDITREDIHDVLTIGKWGLVAERICQKYSS